MAGTPHDARALASDGADVLEGTDPPTEAELAAVRHMDAVDVRDHTETHIAEVDDWKANRGDR